MPPARVYLLTLLALVAFAANSVLCRVALAHTGIDPGSFTAMRLASGALALWLLARSRVAPAAGHGNWGSALALFGYAAGFSYAYTSLPTGTGALLLFGAVQASMIGFGLFRGERLGRIQWAGWVFALSGMVALCLPGVSSAPLSACLLMLGAGVAWGVYSLRGRGVRDPIGATAGNFLRASVLGLALVLAAIEPARWDAPGVACAVASGALTSGMGYAIWYRALGGLRTGAAATVQLAVPVIAALAGIALLGETLTPRLLWSSAAILGGIALFLHAGRATR